MKKLLLVAVLATAISAEKLDKKDWKIIHPTMEKMWYSLKSIKWEADCQYPSVDILKTFDDGQSVVMPFGFDCEYNIVTSEITSEYKIPVGTPMAILRNKVCKEYDKQSKTRHQVMSEEIK